MTSPPRQNNPSLSDQLTLAEAAGQLIMTSMPGPEMDRETEALLRAGKAGGVCLFSYNVASVSQLRDLCASLRAAAPRPILVAADLEGGYVWRLVPPATHPPSAMACGAARRPDLTEALARAVGTEMRALGIDVNLAPTVDVNNNPANPVIATRAYGETPQLVIEHALAAMRGYRAAGVITCAKHFPGHGDTAIDSHLVLPSIPHPMERLRVVELAPFRAAIQAGVEMVMTAHVVFSALDPDLPATLSRRVLTGLLREEMDFRGVICSDAMNMLAIKERWGSVDGSVLSIIAGADLACSIAPVVEAAEIHDKLLVAVRDGRLPESQLRASAARVLSLKERHAGSEGAHSLHEGSRPGTAGGGIAGGKGAGPQAPARPPLETVGAPTHQAAAARLAEASITLHGNPHTLPLSRDETILILEVYAGPATGAEDTRGLHGKLAEAIRRLSPSSSSLALDVGALPDLIPVAVQQAQAADVVVLATRNAWRSEPQQALIRALAGAARRLVLVALRDPYDLRLTPPGAAALAAYSDAPASVEAAAGVLFGKPAPGRLPVTL